MNVLLVHNRYRQAGGEEEAFAAESALLRSQGDRVFEYIEDNRSIRLSAAPSAAVRAIWSFPTVRRLTRLLRVRRPDIVHFHNTFPLVSPAAYYACREAGIPVVQTLHNYRLLCPAATLFRKGRVCESCLGRWIAWPGVLHRCYRRSAAQSALAAWMLACHRFLGTWRNQVDRYIALSEFARWKLIQGGLPAGKIAVKPNFVEPDPGPGKGEGAYVLFAGRLSAEKGLDTLLRAWRRLPRIPLLIAGDGPLFASAVRFASRPVLEGSIRVLGRRSRAELFRLMQGARYLIFPSQWYESFPMVIAEAFACGRPVLAAGLGAAAEIVEHGRTGLLVQSGDAEQLADQAHRLWSNPKASRRMGEEARAAFEENYSARRNYPRLRQIYAEALRSRAG